MHAAYCSPACNGQRRTKASAPGRLPCKALLPTHTHSGIAVAWLKAEEPHPRAVSGCRLCWLSSCHARGSRRRCCSCAARLCSAWQLLLSAFCRFGRILVGVQLQQHTCTTAIMQLTAMGTASPVHPAVRSAAREQDPMHPTSHCRGAIPLTSPTQHSTRRPGSSKGGCSPACSTAGRP